MQIASSISIQVSSTCIIQERLSFTWTENCSFSALLRKELKLGRYSLQRKDIGFSATSETIKNAPSERQHTYLNTIYKEIVFMKAVSFFPNSIKQWKKALKQEHCLQIHSGLKNVEKQKKEFISI